MNINEIRLTREQLKEGQIRLQKIKEVQAIVNSKESSKNQEKHKANKQNTTQGFKEILDEEIKKLK